MTESKRPRDRGAGRLGLWVIGVYKLVKAAVVLTAGVYVARLSPADAAGDLVRLSARLRLDPDNHLVNAAVARLSGVGEGRLEVVGVGIALYSLLYVAQGVGLLLQRRWAEYLVIVTTGYLIPFEAYQVAVKFGPARLAVLAGNLAIVAFLVVRLRGERRARPGESRRIDHESPI